MALEAKAEDVPVFSEAIVMAERELAPYFSSFATSALEYRAEVYQLAWTFSELIASGEMSLDLTAPDV